MSGIDLNAGIWTDLHHKRLVEFFEDEQYPSVFIAIIESYIPFQLLSPFASNVDSLPWYYKPSIYYFSRFYELIFRHATYRTGSHWSQLIVFKFFDVTGLTPAWFDAIITVPCIALIVTFYEQIIVLVLSCFVLFLMLLRWTCSQTYGKLVINSSNNDCIKSHGSIILQDCCRHTKWFPNSETFTIDSAPNKGRRVHICVSDTEMDWTAKKAIILFMDGLDGKWRELIVLERKCTYISLSNLEQRQQPSLDKMNAILEEWINC